MSTDDDTERRLAKLAALWHQYQATKNPLIPWYARAAARLWDMPVPHWVERYLDDATRTLSDMTQDPPRDVAAAVAGAFGFEGKPSAFSKWRQFADDTPVLIAVLEERRLSPEKSLDAIACAVAGAHNKDLTTVKNIESCRVR